MIIYAYDATISQLKYEIIEINNDAKVNIIESLNIYSKTEIYFWEC